eukprot:SAG22_NODE_1823_length_3509_cov_57.994721_2_plen_89_part_00
MHIMAGPLLMVVALACGGGGARAAMPLTRTSLPAEQQQQSQLVRGLPLEILEQLDRSVRCGHLEESERDAMVHQLAEAAWRQRWLLSS